MGGRLNLNRRSNSINSVSDHLISVTENYNDTSFNKRLDKWRIQGGSNGGGGIWDNPPPLENRAKIKLRFYVKYCICKCCKCIRIYLTGVCIYSKLYIHISQ